MLGSGVRLPASRDPIQSVSLAEMDAGDYPGGLAVSLDGRVLAATSRLGRVKVWDASTGQQRLSLPQTAGLLHALALSADGARLATLYSDRTFQVRDTFTGQVQLTRRLPEALAAVAFVPERVGETSLLAVACATAAQLWDLRSGTLVRTLRGHANVVTGIACSADGRLLATCSPDRTVRRWDIATGKELLPAGGHAMNVAAVAFAPDGTRLASTGSDGVVKLWDVRNGTEVLKLSGCPAGFAAVAFSPDGRLVAAAGRDGMIHVWDGRPAGE
jgi:WD40 repeat protein